MDPAVPRPPEANAPSRDPRLASRPGRPPLVGRDSHSLPNEPQNYHEASGDILVRGISDLVQECIIAANYRNEKERLQNRIEKTDGLLRRAKAHSNFPSIGTFFQQARNEEEVEATRLDETMKDRSSALHQLENSLKSLFGSLFQRCSRAEEEVARLRTEFDGKNSRLRAELSAENERLRTELSNRQSQIEDQQSRLNRLQGELVIIRSVAQKTQTDSLDVKRDIEKLHDTNRSHQESAERTTGLQNRVVRLEKLTADHSKAISALSVQSKDLEGRMEKLNFTSISTLSNQVMPQKWLEERIERPTSKMEQRISSPFDRQSSTDQPTQSKQLEDRIQRPAPGKDMECSSQRYLQAEIDQKISSLRGEISELLAFQKSCSERLLRMGNTIVKYEGKLELLGGMEAKIVNLEKASMEKIGAFDSRLTTLDNKYESGLSSFSKTVAKKSDGSEFELRVKDVESRLQRVEQVALHYRELDAKIKELSTQLSRLCDMQAMKDDLQFSTVEEVKQSLTTRMGQVAEQCAALKNGLDHVSTEYNRISKEVKSLACADPLAFERSIENQSQSIQRLGHVVETVRMGLHSLEMRYNGLSTEPILKNMVAAMQEMYPSAGALVNQVTALRTQVNNLALPDLRARLNMISDDWNRLNQSLAAVWEKVNQQTQWPAQQFKELQSNVVSIDQKLSSHVLSMEQQAELKQEADKVLMQSLNEERNRLDGQVGLLSSEMKSLAGQVSELKSAKEIDSQEAKHYTKSIRDRLEKVEEVLKESKKWDEGSSSARPYPGKRTGRAAKLSCSASPPPKTEPSASEAELDPEPNSHPSEELAREQRMAVEANAAVAVRNHKKKKRKRSSAAGIEHLWGLSEDEMSTSGGSNTPSASQKGNHPAVADKDVNAGSYGSRGKIKPKKKKKCEFHVGEPITID